MQPQPKAPKRQRYPSIPVQTLLYIAWCNIVTKRLRSFLTLLGVIIGIGAIFFLLSFGLGLQNLVTKQVVGNQSIKTIDIQSPSSKIIKLDEKTVEKFKNLPNVAKVGVQYTFPGSLSLQGSDVDAVVYGLDNDYLDLESDTLIAGRYFKAEDANNVALVNRAALKAIGLNDQKPEAAIGKDFSLLVSLAQLNTSVKEINKRFKVIGVLDPGAGTEVFLPNSIFSLAGVPYYTKVKVVANAQNTVTPLRKQIESQGFTTTSPIDTIDQINQIFKIFNIVMVGFGSVGMVVAILGMGNTLTISLLERTKEIGLMMALGGRRRDMRRLFVFEALLLSISGSIIGILAAIGFSQVINGVMNRFAQGRGVEDSFQLFAYPLWLMLAMVLFMVGVGMAVVFFPARRAQRINPIDALRRE